MKYLVIVSVVAFLAACGSDKKTATDGGKEVAPVKQGELKIAFFNSDSIPKHFEFHKAETAKMEAEAKRLEGKAAEYQRKYDAVMQEYQRGASSNSLSENQIRGFENKLGKMQQDMQYFQQSEMAKYQEKELKSSEVLINKIAEYSASFAKEKGFSMFFIQGQGSSVAYADPAMDMTEEFIEYMNKKENALDGMTKADK